MPLSWPRTSAGAISISSEVFMSKRRKFQKGFSELDFLFPMAIIHCFLTNFFSKSCFLDKFSINKQARLSRPTRTRKLRTRRKPKPFMSRNRRRLLRRRKTRNRRRLPRRRKTPQTHIHHLPHVCAFFAAPASVGKATEPANKEQVDNV